ncbi:MAG: hypothetical protein LBH13_07770 [Cellulomonadaceae bacterium]|jgi:hypothetical protein|nr:hypothetical protein [Cellulomonadaceae bacterium]
MKSQNRVLSTAKAFTPPATVLSNEDLSNSIELKVVAWPKPGSGLKKRVHTSWIELVP